jgi:dihydrofolate reductase
LTPDPELHLIAAVAKGGCIGKDGALPWRVPEDLRHFKALTLGHAIVMGRKTFESIGKALPGRTNIVVTTRPPTTFPDGVRTATSLDAALEEARAVDPAPYIIGGGEIYRSALPFATHLHITHLDIEVPGGDAFFPPIDPATFFEVARRQGEAPGVAFVDYARR